MATCSVTVCSNEVHSQGLCNGHYQRKRKGRDLETPLKLIKQGENRVTNPLYTTYRGMIDRCCNPGHKYFSYYGGRGIKVCERWLGLDGFSHFIADMGPKPKGMTLDRKNNDGNYEPANCRWASRTTQQINQRISQVNTSGFRGVHWFKNANLWQVYIDFKGKRKNVGYFKTKEEAIRARVDAELERSFNNTN